MFLLYPSNPVSSRFLVKEYIWKDKHLLVSSKSVLKVNKVVPFFKCKIIRALSLRQMFVVRGLVVSASDLRSETKGSQFKSGC